MAIESTVPNERQSDSERQGSNREEDTRSEESFVPPAVDIYEQDGGLVVLMDVPGVDPSDLNVRMDNGILTVQGRAHHMAIGEPVYREFQLSGFYRQFRLADDIDNENVDAELKNGVLKLDLKRAAKAEPRRIDVRTT